MPLSNLKKIEMTNELELHGPERVCLAPRHEDESDIISKKLFEQFLDFQ
jgi:hypothetical protein